MVASHQAVTKVNADVAPKVRSPRGRVSNRSDESSTPERAVNQQRSGALAGWKQQHGDKGRVKETGEALLVPAKKFSEAR